MPTLGIITDTHIPQRLARLPQGVQSAFQGVDTILHAGDLNRISVLEELDRIAPTLAVRGNADLFNRALPVRRVVEFGGRRIGLIHGHRNWPRYLWQKLLDRLRFKYQPNVYTCAARAAFDGDAVDAIVFGHTHRPHCATVGGVLMFNPGPIAPNYYTTLGPQVGLLHIEQGTMQVEIVEV